MKSKELVHLALTHQPIDYLPTQIKDTQNLAKTLSTYFGVSIAKLPVFLGNHMLRVELD